VSTATPPAEDATLLLLTVEEAGRRLGIGRTTAYALVGSGDIESVPIGRLRRVPVDALVEYVARLRSATARTYRTAA
jgi:excisionase family DNA binding protein